jgi:hypothetical protein
VEPTQRGAVIVTNPAAPPPPPPPPAAATLTIAASRNTVIYGQSVALTGELSSGAAGERVEVLASSTGDFVAAAVTKVTEVATTAGGEFRVFVKPSARTVYRVRWKSTTSGRVAINVRPRIGLGIVSVGRGIFSTKATSARSYAGATVWLQRAGRFGQWVSIKRVRLGALGNARFQARLPRGVSRVRVYMTPRQAGTGYMAGMSPTRIVRR